MSGDVDLIEGATRRLTICRTTANKTVAASNARLSNDDAEVLRNFIRHRN